MKNILERKKEFKKKHFLRMIYHIGCLIIAASTSIWMWDSINVYLFNNVFIQNLAHNYVHELLLVGLIYCVVYWIFSKMYHAIKLGEYKVIDLLYFQLLAFGMATGILVVASMLWFRSFALSLIFEGLIIVFVQLLLAMIWIWLMNKVWFKNTEPRRVVLIYGKDDFSCITNKIETLPYVYDLQHCFSDTTAIDELKEYINSMDCVYLYKVHRKVRREIVMYCNQIDKDVYLSREVEDLITRNFELSHTFDTPFVKTNRSSVAWYYPIVKRLFDILVSGLAIIVLSPVFIITAILIKLYDHGPALYSQIRLTQGHKEFKIYKFRSMIVNAEKNGACLSSQNDNRITPIGKFIRATRIDELPQLFNIFKGDMTIVGPRPERPEIEEQYLEQLPEFALRLQVKAGLTGYAQVYGKYNTTPEDKLKLDLLYINGRSVLLDLKIILYTIKILFMEESTEGIEEGSTTAMKSSVN